MEPRKVVAMIVNQKDRDDGEDEEEN